MDDLTRKIMIDDAVGRLKQGRMDRVIAQKRAAKKVQIFIQVQRFSSLVKSGVKPKDAAARVGINIPVSEETTPTQLRIELEKRI